MDRHDPLAPRWEFASGRLCLDFTNTVSKRCQESAYDKIGDYAALVAWCGRGGLLTAPEKQQLLRRAGDNPRAAADAYRTAIRLREALNSMFTDIADDRKPGQDALEIVNRAISGAFTNLRVVEADDGFVWQWRNRDDAFDSVLWPVVRSAGELLTARELPRVRCCASSECSWLFLDTSKNHSRRWCSMEVCGNRAKGRRHYTRQRTARAGARNAKASKLPN